MRGLTIGNINHGCNQLSIYSKELRELPAIFFRTEVVDSCWVRSIVIQDAASCVAWTTTAATAATAARRGREGTRPSWVAAAARESSPGGEREQNYKVTNESRGGGVAALLLFEPNGRIGHVDGAA